MGKVMKKLLSAAAISLLATTAFAMPVTYNVSATGFSDEFLPANEPTGMLTGSFVGDDTSGDGFLQEAEITSFSFMTSGFVGTGRNFTLDDTNAVVDLIDNSGGTNEISPGVSLGLLDISSNDFNTILQIDLQVPFPGFATTFSTANDPEFAFLRSENFTINGVNPNDDDMGVVPLPAALPLFLGGLAIFGLFARRRAA